MKVNEIFYSLQGEGFYAGSPAIFVRFCYCNLACPFCDTDFRNGQEMTEEQIVEEVKAIGDDCRFVVLTGGEPTIQVRESLIDKLHAEWFFVAMETNGTRPWPINLDWVTVSPKAPFLKDGMGALYESNPIANEVKVVYNGDNAHLIELYAKFGDYRYIQPCDTGNAAKNKEITASAVEWLKAHPDWRLSLQTQKIINVR